MQKYVPRLHIVEEGKSINTFVLDETTFMAVTSYQNEQVRPNLLIILFKMFYIFI